MVTLKQFLDREGRSISDLARRVGVAPSTIFRILNGERRPSLKLAKRISAETGVPVKTLLPEVAQAFGAS